METLTKHLQPSPDANGSPWDSLADSVRHLPSSVAFEGTGLSGQAGDMLPDSPLGWAQQAANAMPVDRQSVFRPPSALDTAKKVWGSADVISTPDVGATSTETVSALGNLPDTLPVRRRVVLPDGGEHAAQLQEWKSRQLAKRNDESAITAELEAAGVSHELAASTDEQFGKGTALALVRGEISYGDLNEGNVARTEQARRRWLNKQLVKDTTDASDDVRVLGAVEPTAVQHELIPVPGAEAAMEVSTVMLDDGHAIEVIEGESGKIADVIVTVSGPNETGETETHTVEVRPAATAEGEARPTVIIDGEATNNPNDIEVAEAVLKHTVGEVATRAEAKLDNVDGDPSAQPEKVQPATVNKAPDDRVAPKKPPTQNPEARMAQQARTFRGGIASYTTGRMTGIFREVAAQSGIDVSAFAANLKDGSIKMNPDSVRALHELMKEYRPGSPVWAEKPNANTNLGRASLDARKKLATLIQSTATS